MTETWCALLNVLILSIVTGMNTLLLHRQGQVKRELHEYQNGSNGA